MAPFYSDTAGRCGYPAIGLSRMYVVLQRSGFSNERIEDAIYDSQVIRNSTGAGRSWHPVARSYDRTVCVATWRSSSSNAQSLPAGQRPEPSKLKDHSAESRSRASWPHVTEVFQCGKSGSEDGCCTNWPAPINTLQQHRQLSACQRHTAAGCLWSDKAPLFQPFAKQAQAVAIPPQQFDPVTASSTKYEDLTGEGIGFQLGLHQSRQSIEATARVRDAGGRSRHGFQQQEEQSPQ